MLTSAITQVERLVLRHSDYLVSLEFAALTYRRPELVRYRYRLRGLFDEWIETDAKDRKAVFSSLPPGEFHFEVQASLEEGPWIEPGTSLTVVVLPPWYLTWWARLGAGLLLFLVIVSWPLLRLARERKHNALLEDRITARTAKLAEANRQLEASSLTDYLTRLPNRRHFIARAEKESISFKRTGRSFSVAIADIDNFKAVNDTWGHEAGDVILRMVADLLRNTIREMDTVARWGGEEFIFLFPETELDGATTISEKVRKSVDRESFRWNEEEIPITLTIGLAQVAADASVDACASRADTVLFHGKRSGKNQVVVSRDHALESPASRPRT